MKIDDIYRVKIIGLDHYGRGIARVNNQVVFISNALKDEEVDIKITKVNKKFCEGIVVSFVKESDIRIKAICPYFNQCGGCDLMHMSYENQLKFKENKIREIIHKFTSIDDKKIRNIIGCVDTLYYRNKVRFHVIDGNIGFFSDKTRSLVIIDKCFIADKKINNVLLLLKKYSDLANINEITIRSSKNIDNIMVSLDLTNAINKQELINLLKNEVDSIIINNNSNYETIYGNSYIKEKIGDLEFIISAPSFFQVNSVQTEILYEKVLEYASLIGKEDVLDLYCGTGTIGLFLSRSAKNVLGIEVVKSAVENANINKKINNIDNINFKCHDLSKLSNIDGLYDVIVVDPPRAGLSDITIKNILKIKPKRLVYVSCDPVTLARDLNKLIDYEVIELTPVDMFPNTYHVESVALMYLK